MNNFPKNLNYLPKLNDITQQQLAEQIKKANTTIGNWENGLQQPSSEELLLLSTIFGVSIQELIEGDWSGSNYLNRSNVKHGNSNLALHESEPSFSGPVLAELKKLSNNIEELKTMVDTRLPK